MSKTIDHLKVLADLLEKGLISREDYEKEKNALMAEGRSAGAGPSATMPGPNRLPGAPTQIPTAIGSYRILGEIGQGGMGVVYRARHRSEIFAAKQGGDVAIKVLHPQYAARNDVVKRFEREADLGIKLEHPGIVRALELLIDAGQVALVMELVAGQSLDEMIGDVTGPIPWDRAQPLFQQLLDAVGYAHAHKVVHRDLKPENVIVEPSGSLKVLDFGIAKDLTSDKTKTSTGMGTVDYMAPEQYLDAKSVDQRADIYALGMTLYEMVAGRLPWDASSTEFSILEKKKNGKIPPPTDYYPDIPPRVVAAISKATATEIGDRFSSTKEFASALGGEAAAMPGPPAQSVPRPLPEPPVQPRPELPTPPGQGGTVTPVARAPAPVASVPAAAPAAALASSSPEAAPGRPVGGGNGIVLAVLALLVVGGGVLLAMNASKSDSVDRGAVTAPTTAPVRTIGRSEISFSASSALDNFTDSRTGRVYVFQPYVLGDGELKTCWQEGRTGSDFGLGEYVTVSFDEPVDITKIEIANGCQDRASSVGDLLTKNSRPKDLRVTSDQGHQVDWRLVDTDGWQNKTVQFQGVRRLSFTIQSVHRGTQWKDTSISELRFKGRTAN